MVEREYCIDSVVSGPSSQVGMKGRFFVCAAAIVFASEHNNNDGLSVSLLLHRKNSQRLVSWRAEEGGVSPDKCLYLTQ